ncbi:MAG TPA: VOC family protein [Solirubrobacteraceae bacterium]|nr:VOC family protein [Solirubrobacteraceae bacterium]
MAGTDTLITRADFAGLATRDLARSVEFYGGALGLPISAHVPERNYAEFETGNLTLSLYNPKSFGGEFHTNANAIALHVEDMESARATLAERGVEFEGDTFDTGVCFMSFFKDPDGNALMLHHRYAPRT